MPLWFSVFFKWFWFPLLCGAWTFIAVWVTIRFGRRQKAARPRSNLIAALMGIGVSLIGYSISVQQILGMAKVSVVSVLVLITGLIFALGASVIWFTAF